MCQDKGPEGPWPCLCNERTFCWCREDCEAALSTAAQNAKDAARYRKWREAHVNPSSHQQIWRLLALADTPQAVDKAMDAP